MISICYLLLLPLVLSAPACLRFATTESINQLFVDGGPGTKVLLCPSKVYRLSGTIIFTAADQELATYGYPTGSDRARLIVDSPRIVTAIQGDCRRCARIALKNLIIDGNRQKLGRVKDFDAGGLVIIGGNEGQSVTQCSIRDPRGFTAIHVREGDKLSCSGALLEKNEIGPVGDEYIPAVDGDDPETSPLGRPLADGVTIACRRSIVRDNVFFDNTDAAIVVYCSPGSQFHNNKIYARKQSAMAGIMMVDASPFNGDYTGTTVKDNVIDAVSKPIRVGIGIGTAVLSDDTETILRGGIVRSNGIKGDHMGYGIAASGLEGWTIEDNWDEAKHTGKRSNRCFEDFTNPDPMPFLYHQKSIKKSTLQPSFVDGEFQYVICIDGLESQFAPQKEQRTEDLEEKTSEKISTGSKVMDDILAHSQQRMMERIEALTGRLDQLANTPVKRQRASKPIEIDDDVGSAITRLNKRVIGMETQQGDVIESVHKLREGFKAWYDEYFKLQARQSDSLSQSHKRLLEAEQVPSSVSVKARKKKEVTNWNPLIRLVLLQGVFGICLLILRGWWRSRRRHTKLS